MSPFCPDLTVRGRPSGVIPAKAGIQGGAEADWMPACAGMTERGRVSQQDQEKRPSGGLQCLLTSELINNLKLKIENCFDEVKQWAKQ